MKKIIINTDDFGYSRIFNEEILELAKNDKITGISVMVNYLTTDQEKQIESLKKYKEILGLHVDFENIDLKNVNFEEEIRKQFLIFKKTFSFEPKFLDMHKYSHKKDGQKAIEEFSKKNNIFFRNLGGVKSDLTTSEEKITGSFLNFNEIKKKIKLLPKNSTVTILFHPGRFDKKCKSSFNKDRIKDIKNIILLNSFIENNSKKYKKITYNDLI